jgi:hypothetical protein
MVMTPLHVLPALSKPRSISLGEMVTAGCTAHTFVKATRFKRPVEVGPGREKEPIITRETKETTR